MFLGVIAWGDSAIFCPVDFKYSGITDTLDAILMAVTMIDIQKLRKALPEVVARLKTRNPDQPFFDAVLFEKLEHHRKSIQSKKEDLEAKRNDFSKEIGKLMKAGEHNAAAKLKTEIEYSNVLLNHLTVELEENEKALDSILVTIPNLPHESVPVGASEEDNVLVRTWMDPLSIRHPKDHVEIGAKLGLDFEAGTALAGTRFSVMKGQMATLHRALTQFMLDVQTRNNGYTEYYVPYIVNAKALRNTGQLPKFEEDLFAARKGGQEGSGEDAKALYLIPTAEVPLTNLVAESMLAENELPIKVTAHTPCFRSEAGSAGRDTRGMIRQHQFDKVEMVQVVHPEKSYEALESMVGHAESILQALGLPYRVMLLCTGDMGFGAAKTYDLEVWIPSQNKYREISSVSNCEAFQARRLQTRFKNGQGKKDWVHTLNGSGLAVGRTLVAILENFQNEDGSVSIPKPLIPYMNGIDVLK